MQQYLIAIGSNLGDRQSYIEQALKELGKFAKIAEVASIIETLPIGPAQHKYLNTACTITCDLAPLDLLAKTQSIEQKLGRTPSKRWGDRVIDLDIILWQKEAGNFPIFKHPSLSIPHLRCHEREFVLKPATEVAGDWRHQVLNISLTEIYKNFIKLPNS